jgi:hypothetical protein
VRAFLAAYDIAYGVDGELPTFLAKITLDGVEFDLTVDHLRALVGDEFGPPCLDAENGDRPRSMALRSTPPRPSRGPRSVTIFAAQFYVVFDTARCNRWPGMMLTGRKTVEVHAIVLATVCVAAPNRSRRYTTMVKEHTRRANLRKIDTVPGIVGTNQDGYIGDHGSDRPRDGLRAPKGKRSPGVRRMFRS